MSGTIQDNIKSSKGLIIGAAALFLAGWSVTAFVSTSNGSALLRCVTQSGIFVPAVDQHPAHCVRR